MRKMGLAIAILIFFLGIKTASADDATLLWDPNPETDIAGYKVYVGRSSQGYDAPVDVGNTTTWTVTGLSGSVYYFAVTAYDSSGNESLFSNEVSKAFAAAPDQTAPLISSVTTSGGATILWGTDEPSDSQVQYGVTAAYGASSGLNTDMVTVHSQTLTGLQAGTLYHYQVLSRDAAGNLASSADYIFTTESAAPVISGIAVSQITKAGATISWKTDAPADSQIEYGATTAYGFTTTVDPTLLTGHAQSLTGLKHRTTYHYRVRSSDANGNLSISGDGTFKTR